MFTSNSCENGAEEAVSKADAAVSAILYDEIGPVGRLEGDGLSGII